MRSIVHLHIGEPKSGTTYLQAMVHENRALLQAAGLATPGRRQQVQASQDAIRGRAHGALWNQMATDLLAGKPANILISMETLCRANQSAVERAVEAFHGADIRVHITARDVMRSLPAQWQQTTQHRKTWSWQDYQLAVVSGDSQHPAHRNFWSQHDLAEIIRRWRSSVAAEGITVVTVPQSGADPSLLWRRLLDSMDVDLAECSDISPTNESLGASSAEVLRRVNLALEPMNLTEKQYNAAVRGVLARQVLAERRQREDKVALSTANLAWADSESARIIDSVRASGVNVVGDLEELRPNHQNASPHDAAPDEAAVAAATMDALCGLVQVVAQSR